MVYFEKYKQTAEKSDLHLIFFSPSLPTCTYFFRFLCAAPHPGYQGHFLVKNTSEKSGILCTYFIYLFRY